jgi:L-glyceraldehyde 3-phosphate reductase
MTSVIVGASSVAHLESSVAALDNLALGEDQLTAIEKWATKTEHLDPA